MSAILAGPSYLPPTWRYAGDDWSGSNALVYTVYSVAPVYQVDGSGAIVYGADGTPVVVTAGTPMDLTGYTVAGSIIQRPREVVTAFGRYGRQQPGAPLSGVAGAVLSASAGTIALSVLHSNTVTAAQDLGDWYADVPPGQTMPTGACSRLVARPMLVDPDGDTVTVGLQAVYVF